jgi:secreted trypsin-like serine protease
VSAVTELLIEARYDGTTGSNSCNGDSGGPLFVKRGEQWYLAGDTSNGDAAKCGVTEGSDISRWANINAPSNRAFILQYVGL